MITSTLAKIQNVQEDEDHMITSTLAKIQNEQEDEEHMITSTLAKIQNVQNMKKILLRFIFFIWDTWSRQSATTLKT